MPLFPGDKLGQFDVLSLLGKGGMGEVYRARDTQLKRDVALKVLPAVFSSDPERLARFQREAELLASLDHPNIGHIYGMVQSEHSWALVLALIEGPTLDDRIKQGPLPPDEAIAISKQIVDALEYAHEHGVIHRDLKPANIKITSDGVVKVLDFGLAKALEQRSADRSLDPENSPTLTMGATQAGVIMGTAAYMSPEQAVGKAADRRSDIFSFGVVLYEMLTGKRPFRGESVGDTLAAVVKDAPDWSILPDTTPPHLRKLLERMLSKDRKQRLQAIGEARIALEQGVPEFPPPVQARLSVKVAWALVGLLGILAAFGWMRVSPPSAPLPSELALSVLPPKGKQLSGAGSVDVEKISPDGSTILLRAAGGGYYLRRLDSLEPKLLTDVTNTGDAFWGPDSQFIAIPTADGLVKIHLPNGAPQLITTDLFGGERGGSWGEKGVILYAMVDASPEGSGLYSVSANGGKATSLEVSGIGNGAYSTPEFLPGGDDFLFGFTPSNSQDMHVYLATLQDGKALNPKLLFANGTAAAYTPAGGGYLLFVREDNLYKQKLNLETRQMEGAPELVEHQVPANATTRTARFSVSRDGSIMWRSGSAVLSQAVAFDRQGKRIGLAGPLLPVDSISVSPDEAHLLASSSAGSWVVESNAAGRVFVGSRPSLRMLWGLDSSKVVTVRGAKLVERSISGTGAERDLAQIPTLDRRVILQGMSPDGSRMVYSDQTKVYSLQLNGNHTADEIIGQRVDNAGLSPDGKWIVYRPRTEPALYVQTLSGKGLRRQIASGGGNFGPVWRADGKEILYYQAGQIWSVGVEGSGDELRFLVPQPLFSVAGPTGNSSTRPLAVSRDGSRIYFLQSTEQPDADVIHIRTSAIR